MKGITQYIIFAFIMAFLTITVFYFLGELLSKEIEVSTISGKITKVINEAEYSKFYFKKYLENEYLELKNKGISNEEIVKKFKTETLSLKLENSDSLFKPENVFQNSNKIVVRGIIINRYAEVAMEMNSSCEVEFIFG